MKADRYGLTKEEKLADITTNVEDMKGSWIEKKFCAKVVDDNEDFSEIVKQLTDYFTDASVTKIKKYERKLRKLFQGHRPAREYSMIFQVYITKLNRAKKAA